MKLASLSLRIYKIRSHGFSIAYISIGTSHMHKLLWPLYPHSHLHLEIFQKMKFCIHPFRSLFLEGKFLLQEVAPYTVTLQVQSLQLCQFQGTRRCHYKMETDKVHIIVQHNLAPKTVYKFFLTDKGKLILDQRERVLFREEI